MNKSLFPSPIFRVSHAVKSEIITNKIEIHVLLQGNEDWVFIGETEKEDVAYEFARKVRQRGFLVLDTVNGEY